MDVDRMIETLRKTEFLREADVRALCTRAKEIIIDEGNVQRVDAPVTVRCLFFARLCTLDSSTPTCLPVGIADTPILPPSIIPTSSSHPHPPLYSPYTFSPPNLPPFPRSAATSMASSMTC